MARGKVGDLVFSRQNGEQISRVRNRHPRNPRSNRQLLQRAIMANVSQLYTAGREIFDHAFEDCNTPAENQRRFMSENTKILRAALASDLKSGAPDSECLGRFAAPGVNGGVPFTGMLCSDGSLSNHIFPADGSDFLLPEPLDSVVTQGDYARQIGLQSGDLYTFLIFYANYDKPLYRYDNSLNEFAIQYQMNFYYAQIQVADLDALTDDFDPQHPLNDVFKPVSGTKADDLANMANNALIYDGFDAFLYMLVMAGDGYECACTCIRSIPNTNLRSRSFIKLQLQQVSGFGLTSNYVLDAWKRGPVDLGNSDLILEGGGDD